LPTFWTISKKFFVLVDFLVKVTKRKEKVSIHLFLETVLKVCKNVNTWPLCKIIAFENSLPVMASFKNVWNYCLFNG